MKISPLCWEFEDELPEIKDSEFDEIFKSSRIISGVRMYPFIEMDDGTRIWIANLNGKP